MADKIVQISRDPFARSDIVRRTIYVVDETSCTWCGREGRQTRRGRYLYQYGQWPDGSAPSFSQHVFCSIECWRAYDE